MEAPGIGPARSAHYLDARSTAIKWSSERRAPVEPEHLLNRGGLWHNQRSGRSFVEVVWQSELRLRIKRKTKGHS